MLQNWCQRRVYGTVLGVILFRLTRMTIFIKKAMQEVAEKLKNWKYAAIRKEITENNEDWNNFYAAWSGITNSESFVPPSWLTDQLWHTCVPHQALIASSSRKLGRELGMPRNTRENMIFAGNASDRQHAQRDPEELHNYSRNFGNTIGNRCRCRGFWEK